ncbi:aminoglycoside N(3)-acetyltransferase [Tateyamaria sp. syn59]|uniref:aminoglycoside N(3)-acetyltransferase n=1 Tax=Tateyamaria sp. syn59 TaxID=2576942 RepID=UPI0011BE7978|nr:AAC(3) family N-acetyltransferase [Tateyamaria sp. syn59]
MVAKFHTLKSLVTDLTDLGIQEGDGLFVHASMKSVGSVVGGPRTVIEALQQVVGENGLVGMPGFSADAYFPAYLVRSALSQDQIAEIENSVLGFDIAKSPTSGMGVIAEMFRTWPGTKRSSHPTVSICLNGLDANRLVEAHSLAWATGEQTPLGKIRHRQSMKILLIGVGWNRCSALHTAETLSPHKRIKTRRFKYGSMDGAWIETPDVADDMNRLFPAVGSAFEDTGAVSNGKFGDALCQLCGFQALVEFASGWIDRVNKQSGETR